MTVKITGLKEVRNKIKNMENPAEFFDDVVSDVAVEDWKDYEASTPFEDGKTPGPHTRDMWDHPERLAPSLYQIDNTKSSQDGKHAIAAILNYGREEIRPVKAKKLFIPKSIRAQSKKLGAKIPKEWKRGTEENYEDADVDYFMTDYAKAYPGTGFIDDVKKRSAKRLKSAVIDKVRRTFK